MLINSWFGLLPAYAVIMLITIQVMIMVSGKSVTGKMNIPFIMFLGRISFPIYCAHWLVGSVLWILYSKKMITTVWVYIAYYAGTAVVSLVLYYIIEIKKLFTEDRISNLICLRQSDK